MKRLAIIVPLALAACNSSPTVTATNASTAEIAKKMDAAGMGDQFVSPGHWEMKMTVAEMTIPGMPAKMAEQMKAHMGMGKTIASCLTPEEAKRPKGEFFNKGNGDCRYDRFSMGAGKIDALMQCTGGGGKRTMTMTGTYGPDAYHMAVASTGTAGADNPMAGMSMKMEMDARRTGECTGKENG